MSPHATTGLPPSDLAWTRRHPSRGKPFMDITRLIDAFGYVIYVALAGLSAWGVSSAILL